MHWLTIAAASLVAACGSSPAKPESTAQIPPPPDYLQPVDVAKPAVGESCPAFADREQSARVAQNIIIGDARAAWNDMRVRLAGEKKGTQ